MWQARVTNKNWQKAQHFPHIQYELFVDSITTTFGSGSTFVDFLFADFCLVSRVIQTPPTYCHVIILKGTVQFPSDYSTIIAL